jgi:hypothetical protein
VKLSAYVPDDLWSRASARFPRSGPSRIVQMGLRRLLERSRPRFVTPAADEGAALLRGRARLARLRQQAYDEGYEAGLALCETLTWADLERMAADNWRVDELMAGADPRRQTAAHRSGLQDALRDAWLGVVRA